MRYEYKVITLKRSLWSGRAEAADAKFEERLNALGQQGWRMTGVTPYGHWSQIFLMRER